MATWEILQWAGVVVAVVGLLVLWVAWRAPSEADLLDMHRQHVAAHEALSGLNSVVRGDEPAFRRRSYDPPIDEQILAIIAKRKHSATQRGLVPLVRRVDGTHGASEAAVHKSLSKLCQLGLIERVGHGKYRAAKAAQS
jgi:hypothetical protein